MKCSIENKIASALLQGFPVGLVADYCCSGSAVRLSDDGSLECVMTGLDGKPAFVFPMEVAPTQGDSQ